MRQGVRLQRLAILRVHTKVSSVCRTPSLSRSWACRADALSVPRLPWPTARRCGPCPTWAACSGRQPWSARHSRPPQAGALSRSTWPHRRAAISPRRRPHSTASRTGTNIRVRRRLRSARRLRQIVGRHLAALDLGRVNGVGRITRQQFPPHGLLVAPTSARGACGGRCGPTAHRRRLLRPSARALA